MSDEEHYRYRRKIFGLQKLKVNNFDFIRFIRSKSNLFHFKIYAS